MQLFNLFGSHPKNPELTTAGSNRDLEAGQWQFACLLLSSMEPDIISYSAACSACEKCGRWEQAGADGRSTPVIGGTPIHVAMETDGGGGGMLEDLKRGTR